MLFTPGLLRDLRDCRTGSWLWRDETSKPTATCDSQVCFFCRKQLKKWACVDVWGAGNLIQKLIALNKIDENWQIN